MEIKFCSAVPFIDILDSRVKTIKNLVRRKMIASYTALGYRLKLKIEKEIDLTKCFLVCFIEVDSGGNSRAGPEKSVRFGEVFL